MYEWESEMNFERDDRGLIGTYEDEFKAKVQGDTFKKDKEKAIENEVTKLFKKINFCLDSMTRMHFTPRKMTKQEENKDEFIIDETVPVGINSYYSNNKVSHGEIYNAKR